MNRLKEDYFITNIAKCSNVTLSMHTIKILCSLNNLDSYYICFNLFKQGYKFLEKTINKQI